MIGVMGSFSSRSASLSSQPLDLYLHGYVSSRLMRLPTTEEVANPDEGLPLCIAATHLDGVVLALTPNHHSMNYRSAVLHGYATLVTSPEEKLYAMELVTNNMVPSRWENTRVPPNKVEMQSTSILRVQIVSASAKVRTGEPGEDRNDEKDEAVRGRVWTGVVPTWIAFGEPVPAKTNRVGVPDHVRELVEVCNRDGEKTAIEAVEERKG